MYSFEYIQTIEIPSIGNFDTELLYPIAILVFVNAIVVI